MRKFKLSAFFSAVLLSLTFLVPQTVASASTVTEVTIDSGSDLYLTPSNTARKIAVSPNGTIFLLYAGASGHYLAKSSDAGSTFSTSSSTVSPTQQAEIAVSSNGDVFIAWVQSGVAKIIRSVDAGATWGSPVDAGAISDSSIHMTVDREYIYILGQRGRTLLRSSDSGASWATSQVSSKQWAFSDILVDAISGVVYVFADDPSVSYYSSADRGATFSEEKPTGKSVYFSTAAIASNSANRFMYMSGSGTNLERVDVLSGDVVSTTVLSERSMTRNVSADGFGNVVSTGIDSGNLNLQVSNDFAANFDAGTNVDSGLASNEFSASTINTTNGDVLVMYEKAGRIVFKRYSGELVGYDLNLDVTYLDFSQAGALTITLTNASSGNLSITEIALASSAFSQANTCGGSLTSGASCTVTVTAISEGSANLRISATGATGSIQRIVPLAFGASSTNVSDELSGDAPSDIESEEVRYRGPVLFESEVEVLAGDSVVSFTGKKLDQVTKASINGLTISFTVRGDASIEFKLPASLEPRMHSIDLISSHGKLTHMNAIRIREDLAATSLTIKGSDVFSGEEFKKLTAFARTQNPEMNTATCIVNSNSEGKSFMQARALCDRIAASNLNIKTKMFETRSTVEGSAIFARVVFSSKG